MHQVIKPEVSSDAPAPVTAALRESLRRALAEDLNLSAEVPVTRDASPAAASDGLAGLNLETLCCAVAHLYAHAVIAAGHQ